jgi:hypothetical protein
MPKSAKLTNIVMNVFFSMLDCSFLWRFSKKISFVFILHCQSWVLLSLNFVISKAYYIFYEDLIFYLQFFIWRSTKMPSHTKCAFVIIKSY